jgi:Holliday junction resolvasome RuvABC endonuclease subunit
MSAPVEDYIYRVVGIDPGTETLGWAIVDLDLKHKQIHITAAGTYYASRLSSSPFEAYELACGNRLQRITLLGRAVRELLGYYQKT